MRLYGIIGFPLAHSFSPDYFNRKFAREHIEARYEAFPIPSIEDLPGLLSAYPTLCGFNVTIPYKKDIIPLLDDISNEAKEIGAVNCVTVRNGRLYGYNTDYAGFMDSIAPLLRGYSGKALVLGTGGSSLAVRYALTLLEIPFLNVSRYAGAECISYEQLSAELPDEYKLIINTTPLGMFPDTHTCPDIPYESLGPQHILYDLVYNPETTLFLQKGQQQGALIKNGADMLYLQAERGWAIWNK